MALLQSLGRSSDLTLAWGCNATARGRGRGRGAPPVHTPDLSLKLSEWSGAVQCMMHQTIQTASVSMWEGPQAMFDHSDRPCKQAQGWYDS